MIWLMFPFILLIILNLKLDLYINSFLQMNYFCLLMSSIIFLAMTIIMMFKFNFESYKEKINYDIAFYLVFGSTFFSFLVSDSFMFLMMVELCVYPMSYLILNYSKDKDKISAVLFMFSINILGSIPFMLYSMSSMSQISTKTMDFSIMPMLSTSYLMQAFMILILISKIPLFLFHFWLTKAHVAASGACSMILASIMLKLGTFGLYKFGLNFISMSKMMMPFSYSLIAVGYFLVTIIMIRVSDMKYLIACSSILHMSMVFPLIMMFSFESLISSLMMMVGHGLISYYLFYLVSLTYEKSLNRTMEMTKSIESVEKSSSMSIFILMFFNLGMPPFIGFYSEMIFMKFMILNSNLMSIGLTILMIMSVIFLMFFLSKILFGKKYNYENKNQTMNLNFYTLFISMAMFFLCMFN